MADEQLKNAKASETTLTNDEIQVDYRSEDTSNQDPSFRSCREHSDEEMKNHKRNSETESRDINQQEATAEQPKSSTDTEPSAIKKFWNSIKKIKNRISS
jgi:hypothetical protein